MNYFAICAKAAAEGEHYAGDFISGIDNLRRGRETEFSVEYPCHGPRTQRWFSCRVKACRNVPPFAFIVQHLDVTRTREAFDRLQTFESQTLGDMELVKHVICRRMPDGEDCRHIRERFGIDVDYFYKPFTKVGGDIWAMQTPDDTRVVVGMVDVSGHGIPAALRGMQVIDHLEAALREPAPDLALRALNRSMMPLMQRPQFLAAAIVEYDRVRCTLRVSSCAWPQVLIQRRDGSQRGIQLAGPPIGVLPEPAFEMECLRLSPGDTVLLYTDGLVDCLNSEDETRAWGCAVELMETGSIQAACGGAVSERIHQQGDDILVVRMSVV